MLRRDTMRCSFVLVTLVFVVIGSTSCSKHDSGPSCSIHDSGPSFGQSFNTIEAVIGDSYVLDGYTSFAENVSGAFAPNAVLVVGVKGGVKLGGGTFDYGCIVIIEGTPEAKTFRLATRDDRIVISEDVTVFGKKQGKGRFDVPAGGKVIP